MCKQCQIRHKQCKKKPAQILISIKATIILFALIISWLLNTSVKQNLVNLTDLTFSRRNRILRSISRKLQWTKLALNPASYRKLEIYVFNENKNTTGWLKYRSQFPKKI